MSLLEARAAQMGRRRVQLHWASAAQGVLFAQTVAQMTEQIKALGPLDWPRHWPDEDPFARIALAMQEDAHE